MRRSFAVRNVPVSGNAAILTSFSIPSNSKKTFSRASRWTATAACFAALLCWTGCIASSSDSNSGPLAISANNGSLQSTVVSTAFGAPLVAVATKGGKPSKGVSVTFTAPSSGASGLFGNNTATETVTTDSNGLATTSKFTANSTEGQYSVTATASGAQQTATFTLTNLAPAQLTISPQNGSGQSALIGLAFPTPLSVVVDQNGSPIEGVSVTFTAPSSGASGTFGGSSPGVTDTVTTDANGQATSSTFTANSTSGNYNVLATVVGGAAPAQFNLTNLSADSLTVVATAGSQQSATIGTVFGAPLQVGVYNQGLGVAGVTVTFTAPPSSGASGTFKGGTGTETDVTDSNGIATSSTFTANQTTGTYQVNGTISGNKTQVQFGLTNTTTLTVTMGSGDGQTTKIGSEFLAPLVANVKDSQSNPVLGVTVIFTAPSSGASGSFSSSTSVTTANISTDKNGNASTPFWANSAAGSYKVISSVPGATSSAEFNLTNSTSDVSGVVATGGIVQRAAINTQFGKVLVATVLDHLGNPLGGQQVVFTAPSAGATGKFLGGTNSETQTTDANGKATSSPFTANATAGSYNVTATTNSLSATFGLTNSAVPDSVYTFYATGQSTPHVVGQTTNYYAIAGAVIVDQSGNVIGGEEDYNDANTFTYSAVSIASSSNAFVLDPTTGQGYMVLTTNNSNLGVSGVQTFGVQFVNSKHALITEWDGSATSSGSMDMQDLTSAPSGGYAFTLTGVDPNYAPVGFGGVFLLGGSLLDPQWNLTNLDMNDANYGLLQASNLSMGVTSFDSYGRGKITGITVPTTPPISLTLYYYLVGPEVMRIIDMDATLSAAGSAFGQGTNYKGAAPSGIGQSVFAIAGSPAMGNPSTSSNNSFAAAGQFTTDGSGNLSAGVADEKELTNNPIVAQPITGAYTVADNGYGTLTITSGQLGNVSALGLYLTDPNLNLNDPNNTADGTGGALLLDLDTALPGGSGLIVPQTDTATSSFAGNYAVGWQNPNYFSCAACEFDVLAQGSMTVGGALNFTGLVSDPFGILSSAQTPSGVSFQSNQPQADTSNPGRWTMPSTTNPPDDLVLAFPVPPTVHDFDVTVYQASGGQLFWLEVDNSAKNSDGAFLGPLEQQGDLSSIPASRNGSGKVKRTTTKSHAAQPSKETT